MWLTHCGTDGPLLGPLSRFFATARRPWPVKLFVEKAHPGTIAGDERPELAAALLWAEEKSTPANMCPDTARARPARPP